MTEEIDIYRSANLLVKQHGPVHAEINAAQRADEMLAAGDLEGRRTWLRILDAVKEISESEPTETVH